MLNETVIVKVSGRNRITLPRVVRERLGIRAGDRLLVDVQDKMLILASVLQDHATRLAGLHHDIWDDVDTDAYLCGERGAWED